jgi:hypothetical protein
MRVLYWYCDTFAWNPSIKTIEEMPDALPERHTDTVVAFVPVEPGDVVPGSGAETKLVKNAKWVARKWEVNRVILHSFTHLGEAKADPEPALELLNSARQRLESAGYTACLTPYGYFNDLTIEAKGHPLGRIYKEF